MLRSKEISKYNYEEVEGEDEEEETYHGLKRVESRVEKHKVRL